MHNRMCFPAMPPYKRSDRMQSIDSDSEELMAVPELRCSTRAKKLGSYKVFRFAAWHHCGLEGEDACNETALTKRGKHVGTP